MRRPKKAKKTKKTKKRAAPARKKKGMKKAAKRKMPAKKSAAKREPKAAPAPARVLDPAEPQQLFRRRQDREHLTARMLRRAARRPPLRIGFPHSSRTAESGMPERRARQESVPHCIAFAGRIA